MEYDPRRLSVEGGAMRCRLVAMLVGSAVLMLTPMFGGAGVGPVVLTQSGAVMGLTLGNAAEWRGIPYAAPPLGVLRWRPPAPVQPWMGVRDATTFKPECIQLTDVNATDGSEDCLYLNVFVPANATPSSRLPVMVHLHGGGNTF